MANDLQTNLDIIDDFTQRLQVAVIGAEETTAKHQHWVEGTSSEVIQTINGPIKTLRGLIADWDALFQASFDSTIEGYDSQFADKLDSFDNDFLNYLLNIGFEPAEIYQGGITIERRSQTVAYDGVTYYWAGTLPFTTTGVFANEADWLIAPIVGGIEIPQITFATGGNLVRKTQSVLGTDGEWYFWTGSFPKTIPVTSTLESAGGVGLNKFKLASGHVPVRPMMKILSTAAGFVLNAGSFEYGATITSSSQVLPELNTGRIWKWDGPIPKVVDLNSSPASSGGVGENLWNEVVTATGSSGSGITIGATKPTGVGSGHRWFCTTDGRTYVYFADGDSVQWVEESPQNSVFDGLEPRVREALRRSYAEAGYNVAGTFQTGFTYVNANDVGIDETTGKGYTGPVGPVAPGTNPTSGSFVDVSGELLRNKLSPEDSEVVIAGQLASVLHNTYIITGRANIANPYWGAPTTDTLDPAAATANAVAIQKMLDSGARMCELDEKPRYIVDTLTMSSIGQTFCGQGKGVKGLEFRGGNVPVIARPNWSNINASGKPGMRVEHMLISDKSTGRTTAWSIDLTNGDSCGLEHVTLFGDDGAALSNNYGVALGTAFGGSSPDGPAFVCHLRHSRLSRAKAVINTTDSYVTENELWGNKRDFALQLGAGGSFVFENQIVPGELYGIYLNSPSGYLHDILRIIGNYFDGSYTDIYTGVGIYQAGVTGGILNSVVEGNSLWHLNGRGMRFENVQSSRIVNNNFVDCASSDLANTPDVYIGLMTGSKVDNTHSRSSVAPKTGSARTNLSPPLQITANTNTSAAMNEISQSVVSSSTYIDSQLAGATKIIDMGRIINRGSDPEYAQGVIMMKLGVPYIGANGVWKPI